MKVDRSHKIIEVLLGGRYYACNPKRKFGHLKRSTVKISLNNFFKYWVHNPQTHKGSEV